MKAKKVIHVLEEIYQQEIKYYSKLLNLTQQQTTVIEAVELDELESLLEEKNEVMQQIDQLEEKLQPYKEEIIEKLNLAPDNWLIMLAKGDAATSKLKERIVKVINLLQKLTELDQKNQTLIKEKQAGIAKEFKEVKKAGEVNRSYSQNKRIHSTFIDEKS